MRYILPFAEADPLIKPYYVPVMNIMDEAIEDCNKMLNLFSDNSPAEFKNRTKGSFINDRLKTRMAQYFQSDPNVRIIECRGVFGVLISDKLFIRFNKMDKNFKTSISKKTKQTQKFLTQADLPGFPAEATLIWGGYNPDKTWSKIESYYLVCFYYGLNWQYDIGRNERVEQLSIELPLPKEQPQTRRVRAKKKKGDGDTKEGTND